MENLRSLLWYLHPSSIFLLSFIPFVTLSLPLLSVLKDLKTTLTWEQHNAHIEICTLSSLFLYSVNMLFVCLRIPVIRTKFHLKLSVHLIVTSGCTETQNTSTHQVILTFKIQPDSDIHLVPTCWSKCTSNHYKFPHCGILHYICVVTLALPIHIIGIPRRLAF
jgi:hypothetical protein